MHYCLEMLRTKPRIQLVVRVWSKLKTLLDKDTSNILQNGMKECYILHEFCSCSIFHHSSSSRSRWRPSSTAVSSGSSDGSRGGMSNVWVWSRRCACPDAQTTSAGSFHHKVVAIVVMEEARLHSPQSCLVNTVWWFDRTQVNQKSFSLNSQNSSLVWLFVLRPLRLWLPSTVRTCQLIHQFTD